MEDLMNTEIAAIDLVRDDPTYYTASTVPELVEIDPVRVLAREGRGEPGGHAHLEAINALNSVVCAARERVNALNAVVGAIRDLVQDRASLAVPPLEGLWWVEDQRPAFDVPREE